MSCSPVMLNCWKYKCSVFVKDGVIQEYQSRNHALSQAPMSSAACCLINTFDSQVDVTRSPCPEAAVTHTSVHFNISLLFAHVCFSLRPMDWVSPSENRPHHHHVALLLTRWVTSALEWKSASGLKTKVKWWCRSIRGMCNKITESGATLHEEVFSKSGHLGVPW